MSIKTRLFAPILTLGLLSACATTPAARPNTPASKPYIAPPAPIKLDKRGLESVLGAEEPALTRMFGKPRLDVVEVNGRKLQYMGEPCILDAYLYPDNKGVERVTYVDARNRDGAAVDRAACVEALQSDR
jgi:hypothetical protein